MRCAFAAAWDAWQGVLGLELPEGGHYLAFGELRFAHHLLLT